MNSNRLKKIVLLDFCSEKNRGDAAIQVGLLKLVYKNFPNAKVSIISVFGANQYPALKGEYDHSVKFPVRIFGGLKPTFYPIINNNRKSNFQFELLQAVSFVVSLLMLLAMKLGIPSSLFIRFLSGEYRKTFKQILEADLVIWRGRNFRSRNNMILEIYRTSYSVFHPLICGILAKPMVCLGASAWSLNSSISRHILRSALNKCAFISLREEYSYAETLKLMGSKDSSHIELLPDLSFAALGSRKAIIQKRKIIRDTKYPKTIGFTIVDWTDEGIETRNAYKESIIHLIDFFNEKGSSIVFIPQVTKNWESATGLISDLATDSIKKRNITYVEGAPSIDDLLSIYSDLDMLIATRMHSAIFAATVNTPLVAIPYDSGGKWGILDDLGYKDYLIPYGEITPEKLMTKVFSCWENRKQLLHYSEKKVEMNIKNVDLNVSRSKNFIH